IQPSLSTGNFVTSKPIFSNVFKAACTDVCSACDEIICFHFLEANANDKMAIIFPSVPLPVKITPSLLTPSSLAIISLYCWIK
ncbi:hypothetical protein, partial [Lysinibacillus sp. D4B1_S16]|uniref:hypothetical protein n=1 Tax=Lysinibacillus sp. D4B1_S16 TaxID=2941231 RepID=UPI0020C051F0